MNLKRVAENVKDNLFAYFIGGLLFHDILYSGKQILAFFIMMFLTIFGVMYAYKEHPVDEDGLMQKIF